MRKPLLLSFLLSAVVVFSLAPRLVGRGGKGVVSPLVSGGEPRPARRPRPTERVLYPFGKILGLSARSSGPSASAAPAAEGKKKPSLIREYFSKAADGFFGQVLGLKDEAALDSVSTPAPTPTAASAPTPSPSTAAAPGPTAASTPTPTSAPASTPTPEADSGLTADQQGIKIAAEEAGEALVRQDYSALYGLMASDFRDTYSEAEFLESVDQGQDIVYAQTVDDPEVFGANEEWGRVTLELVFADGSSRRYLVVSSRSGEAWEIFGTEEIP